MSSIMCFEKLGIFSHRFLKQGILFLLFVEVITRSSGITITRDNTLKKNSTNYLDQNTKVNYTENEIIIPTKSTPTHSNHKTTNSSTSLHSGVSELFNRNVPTEMVVLSTSASSISFTIMNSTTTGAPTRHHKKTATHSYKILLYILIPVSVVFLLVVLYFTIRRIQKVKRKRRLERELIHQYSYPNSEAGDIDGDDRLFEVESVINAQFHTTHDDQQEKNFVAEIPEVTVAIGEGPRLVLEEESPLIDNEELQSTSFNC